MKRIVRIGSRESALALKQAEIVIDSIKKHDPSIVTELITIKTMGDKILDKTLDKIGGKGLFIKELETALLDNRIDLAVHSYKDMPWEETPGLPVVALSEREAPFDALVLPPGIEFSPELFTGSKPVGSSSIRRNIQLCELYKGCKTLSVRGNVLTRLKKLDMGEYSALILAQAGLNRLSLHNRVSKIFTPDEMIPSASQGILAVQGREGEDYSYLRGFNSESSQCISKAERRFLKTLEGGCSSPVAAYGEIHNNELLLRGMYVDDNGHMEKGVIKGLTNEAEKLGEKLALKLKNKGEGVW